MAGVTCHKKSRRGYCLLPDNLFLRSRYHAKKSRRGYCHHDGQSISPHTTLQTWTHSRHQMSLASYTSILFHSSFDLLHMSLIKPHPHIHTTTQVSQQPSHSKHHITHLILQFFPASSLTHFAHFIQISFNLNPNSPFSFLKHPQDFISILLFFYTSNTLSHRSCSRSFSISFSNNGKSKSVQKTSRYQESRNE